MLSASNLTVRFGDRTLFNGVTFNINRGDRIGLVGRNGAGKSTLLKMLAGEREPDSGDLAIPKETTIGYLPQQMTHQEGRTVWHEAVHAFEELQAMKRDIDRMTEEMATRTDFESDSYLKLLDRHHELNERFSMLGGYSMEGEVEKVLSGLGFEQEDFERQTSEFSGGWRMRIELGKILLRKPDLILLDEPTNHLDIESIQWLEEFMSGYGGAVVLVSHDRAFLDNVTNRTIEISTGRVYDYPVPYSKFVQQSQERRELQQAAYENQQKQIKDTEKFIERFRYKATKSNQVQSRVKQLEKLDRIEVEEEDGQQINLRFPPAPRSGRIVVDVDHVRKAYEDNLVLQDISMKIERGEKVAFVGKNGEGKSTLSKIIGGRIGYQAGKVNLGHNVELGYYGQDEADHLPKDSTAFEVIDTAATGDMRAQVRSLLGAFLFSGEDADKKVAVLSGGEKSRLALARLLLEPVNLLILDEPTNHLDMRSKDVLKQALQKYDGTLIVVSHDRDFLKGLTDKVYEFRHQQVKEHIGDIYAFLQKRKLESLDQLEQVVKERAAEKDGTPKDHKNQYNLRKELGRNENKLKREIGQLEEKIAKMEKTLKQQEAQMADPAQFHQLPQDVFQEYDKQKQVLETTVERWAAASEELEELRKEMAAL